MARLWARTTTFDTVNPGDELPILVKWETSDTIRQFRSLVCEDGKDEPTQADTGDSGELAMASQALVAYVIELLEKGFPVAAIVAEGSALSLKTFGPVNAEDTISLSGTVTGKRSEGQVNTVECLVTIENQDNVVVAEGDGQNRAVTAQFRLRRVADYPLLSSPAVIRDQQRKILPINHPVSVEVRRRTGFSLSDFPAKAGNKLGKIVVVDQVVPVQVAAG